MSFLLGLTANVGVMILADQAGYSFLAQIGIMLAVDVLHSAAQALRSEA